MKFPGLLCSSFGNNPLVTKPTHPGPIAPESILSAESRADISRPVLSHQTRSHIESRGSGQHILARPLGKLSPEGRTEISRPDPTWPDGQGGPTASLFSS